MIRTTAWRAVIAVLTATCLTMAAAVPASAMPAVDDGPVTPAEPAPPTATRFQTPDVTEIVRGTAQPQPPARRRRADREAAAHDDARRRRRAAAGDERRVRADRPGDVRRVSAPYGSGKGSGTGLSDPVLATSPPTWGPAASTGT